MPASDYVRDLRKLVGSRLLLIPSVTGIVFDDQQRVLLVQHAERGVWVAPGGSIEPKESPADAVVREMLEETGLQVEPLRIIGVFGGPDFQVNYRNGDQVTYVMTVFECRVRGGTLQADRQETLQVSFFSEEQVARLRTSAWMPLVMPAVFRREDRAQFQPARGDQPDPG